VIDRRSRDLLGWLVGLPGLEPGTSSLSGFCPRARFPRITPATWATNGPLETAGDHWEPLGSDGMWTKRGPGRPRSVARYGWVTGRSSRRTGAHRPDLGAQLGGPTRAQPRAMMVRLPGLESGPPLGELRADVGPAFLDAAVEVAVVLG
jgi:hypothetical protein